VIDGASATPKITKRLVDSAQSQAKDYVVWDDELPGFGVRIFASGKRSYVNQGQAGQYIATAAPSPLQRCPLPGRQHSQRSFLKD
jgi:hypothetical protein